MGNFLSNILGWKSRAARQREGENFFLSEIRGVIHIGANSGQERKMYKRNHLNVLWVEAIPDVFKKLCENIQDFPKQRAVNYLLTDQDGKDYAFHLSDNECGSSSIYDFAEHKKIWPDVKMVQTINLKSATLPTMIKKEGIRIDEYDALIMDTQGSELLILNGARELLSNFKYIKTEAANFESYKGGCTIEQLDQFLTANGFSQVRSKVFAEAKGLGEYKEVVYARK